MIALFALVGMAQAGTQTWSEGTAHTLPKGHIEVGIFAPLRWGMAEGLELEIHPLIAAVSPHVALKKGWGEAAGFTLASRHGLALASRGLQFVARPGTGGLLPADIEIPTTVTLDSRLLATRDLAEGTRLTLEARAEVGAPLAEGDWPTLDAPLLYARTHAAHGGVATAVGAMVEHGLSDTITAVVDTDAWFLPGAEAGWSVEARGAARWQPGDGFRAEIGAEFIAGAYPYGTNWHVLPGFDLGWSF
jgi:hypothetical protein